MLGSERLGQGLRVRRRGRNAPARQKKVAWLCLFGKARFDEAVFLSKGRTIRPFCSSAGIEPRGASLGIQRAVVDFAADAPFGQVEAKIFEHHKIRLPKGFAARVAGRHASAIEPAMASPRKRAGAAPAVLVAQVDGGMVPIVSAGPEGRRGSGKVLEWRECKLALVRRDGEIEARYAATMGSPAESGAQLGALAERAGFGPECRVHGVGDGAVWIRSQFEDQFGAQAGYLVDMFHVCEYLEAAAPACRPADPAGWVSEAKSLLLAGKPRLVLAMLFHFKEPRLRLAGAGQAPATPALDCHRYLSARIDQLDYPAAIAAGLPIGSGEVESAHRHIMQARLKRAGAWWSEEGAQAMLNLRVMRANGRWKEYWAAQAKLRKGCALPKAA